MTSRVIHLSDVVAEAGALASRLDLGSVVAFRGPMGAGKTTFISALVAALGSEDWVSSPTFQLVHHYDTPRGPIYHFDLYRLTSQDSFLTMDFLGYLTRSDAIVLIEWPDVIEELLPPHTVFVGLAYGVGCDERVVTILVSKFLG